MRRTARRRHCADARLQLSSSEAARGRRSAKSSREHTQGYAEPSLLKRAASVASCGYNSLRCAWHCGTSSETQVYAMVPDKTNAINRLPLRNAKIILIACCHRLCDHPQTLHETIPEAVGSTRPVRAIWQLQRRSITIWRRPRAAHASLGGAAIQDKLRFCTGLVEFACCRTALGSTRAEDARMRHLCCSCVAFCGRAWAQVARRARNPQDRG